MQIGALKVTWDVFSSLSIEAGVNAWSDSFWRCFLLDCVWDWGSRSALVTRIPTGSRNEFNWLFIICPWTRWESSCRKTTCLENVHRKPMLVPRWLGVISLDTFLILYLSCIVHGELDRCAGDIHLPLLIGINRTPGHELACIDVFIQCIRVGYL